jgi:hypothetical protein
MKGYRFPGDPPQIENEDIIEMGNEVARYDMLTFERVGPRNIIVRVVKTEEYVDFAETLYQINRGEQGGTFQFRQVRMRFWPW